MKIIQLNISDFKKISVAEIRPEGHKVILGGDNGAGKTSVLDAIMVALVGPRAMPEVPVRQGAEGAEITVDCGEVVVKRKIKPDGTGTLSVKTADGMLPASPQKWLDERIGAIAFDPLSFTRLDAKAQANTLRTLVGIDVSDLDAKRAAAYEDRTAINRELKQAEALLATMPRHEGVPESEVSISDLVAKMQAASEEEAKRRALAAAIDADEAKLVNIAKERARETKAFDASLEALEQSRKNAVQSLGAELETLDSNESELARVLEAKQDAEAERLDAAIAELKAQLAKLEAERDGLATKYAQERETRAAWLRERREQVHAAMRDADKRHGEAVTERRDELAATLSGIDTREREAHQRLADMRETLAEPPALTLASVQDELRNAESTNAKVRDNLAWKRAQAKVEDAAMRSKQMTANIAALDAERRERIASASWPVDGLGFDEAGTVTFRGVPLSQASQAEQIRVSMAIGLALNPSLRVVLVRDASLLDDKSLALVAEMAERADAQVWLERVSKADAGAIVIEDGHVVEVAP